MTRVLLAALLMVFLPGVSSAQSAPASATDGAYVWAAACKDCHAEIHAAWDKTKHARAINRLSPGDRQRECIQCHVTGATREVAVDGKVVNHNVQCEACHGPGRAHAEAAQGGVAKVAIVKAPAAGVCEGCHNANGPHFKGFFYAAMAPLTHRVEGRSP